MNEHKEYRTYQEPFPYKTYEEILLEKARRKKLQHGLVVMTGDGGAAGPRIEDQRMLATTTQDYSVTRVVRFSSAGGASGLAHPQFTDTGAGTGSVRILDVPVGTSFATVWRASFSARRGSGVLR